MACHSTSCLVTDIVVVLLQIYFDKLNTRPNIIAIPDLNNVHTTKNGDFSQPGRITHTGTLIVGTYDNLTDGNLSIIPAPT